jgi:hypothetical protein
MSARQCEVPCVLFVDTAFPILASANWKLYDCRTGIAKQVTQCPVIVRHPIESRPPARFTTLTLQECYGLNPLKTELLLHNIYKSSSYLTGNALRLSYKEQPVNAVWGNSRCLLWEPYGTHTYSPYLTGNTLRLHYRAQPVNAVWGNSRCLLWEPYGTHTYSPYLTGNTLRLHYRAQPVNAVWGNSRCLLWEP